MIGSYRGLVTGVEFECANGHVFKKSAGVVAYGKSCPLVSLGEKRYSSISQRSLSAYRESAADERNKINAVRVTESPQVASPLLSHFSHSNL